MAEEPIWQESYNKWNADAWKEMKDATEDSEDKGWAFKSVLWKGCSFCEKYSIRMDETCTRCPLFKDKICHSSISNDHLISEMRNDWMNDDKEAFNKKKAKLLKVLKKYKW